MIDGEREIRLGDDDSQEKRRQLFAIPATGGASSNGRRVRLLSVVLVPLLLATFSASFFVIEKSGPWAVGNVTEKHQHLEDNDDNQGNSSSTWPPLHFIDNLFTSDNEPRRLVVAAANYGYADFADNFANHLLLLNVTNFVLLPLDNEAYKLLHVAYPNHTLPVLPGLATSNVTHRRLDSARRISKSSHLRVPRFSVPFWNRTSPSFIMISTWYGNGMPGMCSIEWTTLRPR